PSAPGHFDDVRLVDDDDLRRTQLLQKAPEGAERVRAVAVSDHCVLLVPSRPQQAVSSRNNYGCVSGIVPRPCCSGKWYFRRTLHPYPGFRPAERTEGIASASGPSPAYTRAPW